MQLYFAFERIWSDCEVYVCVCVVCFFPRMLVNFIIITRPLSSSSSWSPSFLLLPSIYHLNLRRNNWKSTHTHNMYANYPLYYSRRTAFCLPVRLIMQAAINRNWIDVKECSRNSDWRNPSVQCLPFHILSTKLLIMAVVNIVALTKPLENCRPFVLVVVGVIIETVFQ